MKNIIRLLVLICSVAVIIVSCAKKEEETAATTIPTTGTGTTASGTISTDFTGTYNMSWYGAEPSGGCIDNSTALASGAVATGTVAFKKQFIVT